MLIIDGTKYYTRQETADFLGVNLWTIHKYIKRGLRTVRIGVTYIAEPDINTFLESQKVTGDGRRVVRPEQ